MPEGWPGSGGVLGDGWVSRTSKLTSIVANIIRCSLVDVTVMVPVCVPGVSPWPFAWTTTSPGVAALVDPEGHAWEIAHNPRWTLGEDGSIELPS